MSFDVGMGDDWLDAILESDSTGGMPTEEGGGNNGDGSGGNNPPPIEDESVTPPVPITGPAYVSRSAKNICQEACLPLCSDVRGQKIPCWWDDGQPTLFEQIVGKNSTMTVQVAGGLAAFLVAWFVVYKFVLNKALLPEEKVRKLK